MLFVPLRTRIPGKWKEAEKIPFCTARKYCPGYPTADPLLDICGSIVDNQPEPFYWSWTPEQVADWVAVELGHPEFRDAFIRNNIDGKGLILIEADRLPRMNITRFDVIKEVTKGIRELCKLDKSEARRGVSLPIRRPGPLYLQYKASRTGPTAHYMTATNFFRLAHIIRDETTEERRYYALLNHWNRIPPFRPWCPHVMIGRYKPQVDDDYFKVLKDLCIYHLPCEEEKEPEKKPWKKAKKKPEKKPEKKHKKRRKRFTC